MTERDIIIFNVEHLSGEDALDIQIVSCNPYSREPLLTNYPITLLHGFQHYQSCFLRGEYTKKAIELYKKRQRPADPTLPEIVIAQTADANIQNQPEVIFNHKKLKDV